VQKGPQRGAPRRPFQLGHLLFYFLLHEDT
jgi:hypothetical protein